MTFVQSRKYREFQSLSFNINIPPSYNDKNPFDFKPASKHYKNKIGYLGRHPKRI